MVVHAALKEWAVVCEALGRGRQVHVARAGGIEEQAFAVEATRFLLLPTRFHEDGSSLRPDARDLLPHVPPPVPDGVLISYAAEAVRAFDVRDVDALARLAPLQAFDEAVLRSRFDSRDGLLTVVVLRTLRLPEPVVLPVGGWSRGCVSWVESPVAVDLADATPVLSDATFANEFGRIEAAIRG